MEKLFGGTPTHKVYENDLIKIQKDSKAILCLIKEELKKTSSVPIFTSSEICLPDGTILLKRALINPTSLEVTLVKYFNLNETPYTGDLSILNDMICCCNKKEEVIPIIETITPLINTNSVTLVYLPDLSKEFQVERNGLVLDPSEFTISNNIITFQDDFVASIGAEFSELIRVEYYKI
jgi:hypothetical protein